MSYEIVYAKQFVKTSKYMIPLILMGSNNCYEQRFRGWRRNRNWCLFPNTFTLKDLNEIIEKWHTSDNQEFFKYSGKWIKSEQIKNFMQNAIKKALTIEEIYDQSYSKLQCSVIYYPSEGQPETINKITTNTSEEIDNWIDVNKNYKDQKDYYIDISFSWNEPLKISVPASIKGKVVAKVGKRYLIEIEEQSQTLSFDKTKAIVYSNIEEAKKQIPIRWQRDIKFVKYDSKTFNKPKNYVIISTDYYYPNVYIQKRTSSRLLFTASIDNAKRFATEKEALKYINEKLKGRFLKAKEFKVIYNKEENKTI